eukprot:jgi/Botrbrau1/18578/Bobra.0367s0021.1
MNCEPTTSSAQGDEMFIYLDLQNLGDKQQIGPGDVVHLKDWDTGRPMLVLPNGEEVSTSYETSVGSLMFFSYVAETPAEELPARGSEGTHGQQPEGTGRAEAMGIEREGPAGGGERNQQGQRARGRQGQGLFRAPRDPGPQIVSQVQYLGSSEQLLVVQKVVVPGGVSGASAVPQ